MQIRLFNGVPSRALYSHILLSWGVQRHFVDLSQWPETSPKNGCFHGLFGSKYVHHEGCCGYVKS